MACRGVGQGVGAALEVELEAGFGNVQAGVDDGRWRVQGVHSVGTHSCTYERGLVGPAPSTVRVTDMRRERLELPCERVVTVPEGNERARAAVLVPALADAPELTAWAGVRPGSPDDQPMIGQTAIPGVFAALGHYRNGVLFAPATAEIVADQVIDGKVSPLAAAFDPTRFDNPDAAPHSPSGKGSDN